MRMDRYGINRQIYNNAVKVLAVPGQRIDLFDVAAQLRDNEGVRNDAYRRRKIPKREWLSMGGQLVRIAMVEAEKQRNRSAPARERINTSSYAKVPPARK